MKQTVIESDNTRNWSTKWLENSIIKRSKRIVENGEFEVDSLEFRLLLKLSKIISIINDEANSAIMLIDVKVNIYLAKQRIIDKLRLNAKLSVEQIYELYPSLKP